MKKKNKIKKENKINWDSLSHKEMTGEISRLAGPRPDLPSDLPRPDWSPQAIQVLKERYFLKDAEGNPIEDVAGMCWRVAWELARAEVKFGRTRKEIEIEAREFYTLMLKRWFLPNSPTLMNAGTDNDLQYSACFVIPVTDDLVGIFDGVKWQGLIHQSGGGTGFSFSRLRPKGARVKSTMGVASGPVSFMRIYDEATNQIKQGGKRRGANMGILRVDHPDILEFIHCKEDGGITNFNISVTVTNKFMEALFKDEQYDLVEPHTGNISGKMSAKKVWDEFAEGAWKTGDPGVVFIDRINQSTANPIRKEGWLVESTNPCGEQPLYPFDACNLGSIFLKYYVKNGGVDWEKLKTTIHTAVRMLDNVIDMNPFPLPQINETVKKIRRIGLGVGGWADMLIQLEIPYDSEEALVLAEKVMKFINEEGHGASQNLAKERGAFPLWKESIYAGDKPIRNSTVTTIAPTGSIGILADASGGIEPIFAIAFQHIVKSENRTLAFINPIFEEVARKKGFYSSELMSKVVAKGTVREINEIPQEVRNVFGTAHEIDPAWHVRMQAAFQKYTDNAVSKTINLRHNASVDDIKKAYLLAWESGCNGVTVFRDGCKDAQVLNLGIKNGEIKEKAKEGIITGGPLQTRPFKVTGATYRLMTPLGTAFVTINEDENGEPLELFINIGKAGTDLSAMAEALGRTISTSLRLRGGLSPKERAKEISFQLAGIGGSRSVGFGPNKIRSLPDAISVALSSHFNFKTNGNGVHETAGLTNGYTNGEAKIQIQEMHLENSLQKSHETVLFSSADSNQTSGEILVAQSTTSKSGDICPSCGASTFIYEEGCSKCYSCGHSEC